MKGGQLELDSAIIKVVGISNAGCSAIDYMRNSNLEGVEFHDFIETAIHTVIKETHLLFLIADTSQNRDSQDLLSAAKISKELGILTIAVVIESLHSDCVAILENAVDSVVVIPIDQTTGVNELLLDTVRGMTDAVTQQSLIGFDFADLKSLTLNGGEAVIAVGSAEGKDRASIAAKEAVSSLLLCNANVLQNSYGILINISAESMEIDELDMVGNVVCDLTSKDALMKLAMTHNESLGNKIKVTIVATGITLMT